MKTIFEHIEYVKGKPHHIRKRIAFAVATGGTMLVALVWLVGSLSTGAFAIGGSSFAESTVPATAIEINGNNANLAGAAAALTSVSSENAPARIEIIDTTSAVKQKQAEQVILPF
ncbi:MAG: hypothetical protein WC217_02305 [Candidatus Paceibacterota bacterium]|jgi:hypothetical protein